MHSLTVQHINQSPSDKLYENMKSELISVILIIPVGEIKFCIYDCTYFYGQVVLVDLKLTSDQITSRKYFQGLKIIFKDRMSAITYHLTVPHKYFFSLNSK